MRFLLLALMCVIAACKPERNLELVGKWESKSAPATTYDFRGDGSYTFRTFEREYRGFDNVRIFHDGTWSGGFETIRLEPKRSKAEGPPGVEEAYRQQAPVKTSTIISKWISHDEVALGDQGSFGRVR